MIVLDPHNETGKSPFLRNANAIHSESVNILSHLAGAVLFLWILATFRGQYILAYSTTTWLDTSVFTIFLMSAVFCLVASAMFHTSTCHSAQVSMLKAV